MAEEGKRGTSWQVDELDAIISDYFEMLRKDLAGEPYVKSRHSAALMARVQRSHRSVEFKHQNISAVLDKLGMPWIPGYKPKFNYQSAIFDAIDRFLTSQPSELEVTGPAPDPPTSLEAVFVSPPVVHPVDPPTPRRLKQLLTKFDPVERDRKNRELGRAGEAFVLTIERRRLILGERPDLAEQVRWTAQENGDGAGFDIQSFTLDGVERLIEVKTTNGPATTPFFISRNEYEVAKEFSAAWTLYRVHRFSNGPRIFEIAPPLEAAVNLATESWRAFF